MREVVHSCQPVICNEYTLLFDESANINQAAEVFFLFFSGVPYGTVCRLSYSYVV